MNNLKVENHKTIETKVWSVKGWRIIVALALVVASLFTVRPDQLALADKGGEKGHKFSVTFTKWITNYPNMAGIAGGAVGTGTFAGEILNLTNVGSITNIEAMYHMNGSRHSFTAHVFVTQDNGTGMATITGRVTEGWQEGAQVSGEYKVWTTCPVATPGNSMGNLCFQGTLNIQRGSDH
jgi:hypothetical protein